MATEGTDECLWEEEVHSSAANAPANSVKSFLLITTETRGKYEESDTSQDENSAFAGDGLIQRNEPF